MEGHPGLARSRDCVAQWIYGGPENDCPIPPPYTEIVGLHEEFRLAIMSGAESHEERAHLERNHLPLWKVGALAFLATRRDKAVAESELEQL